MHYFFTQEDFVALNREIERVCDRIKDAGKEMGMSCQEGAETFHDNFAYEEGERQQYMWSNRLRELIRIRNNAQVVPPSPKMDKVSLGRIVTVRIGDETKTFRVGSFMVLSKDEAHKTISYAAPLAKAVIGAGVGDIREVHVGGRHQIIEVLSVE